MGKKKTREAKMLREARLRMGYSQQEVANVIGVHMFDSSDHCGLQKNGKTSMDLR